MLEVILLRRLGLFLILGLVIISLVGCGEAETREKLSADGSKIKVDATGKILSEDKAQVLEGYIYDEQTGRYINQTTGIWYIVENGHKVIPPEEYVDPDKVGAPEGINIADRPDNVWKLSEIRNITVQEGDTLGQIITRYAANHFRMNRDWYSKQVLELNNITDPHFIRTGDILKMPIYIDVGSIIETTEFSERKKNLAEGTK